MQLRTPRGRFVAVWTVIGLLAGWFAFTAPWPWTVPAWVAVALAVLCVVDAFLPQRGPIFGLRDEEYDHASWAAIYLMAAGGWYRLAVFVGGLGGVVFSFVSICFMVVAAYKAMLAYGGD